MGSPPQFGRFMVPAPIVSSAYEADTDAAAPMRRGACSHLLYGRVRQGRYPRPRWQQENTTNHQSANVLLNMHPEGNSGVSGMASFEDTSDGVAVKLEVRNLPKPDTFYLAHIHPGTCAEGETHEHGGAHGEEGYGHEHGGSSHEHGGGTHEHGGAEIEYPLSQVKSNSKGHGSSTTTLHDTSVDKL